MVSTIPNQPVIFYCASNTTEAVCSFYRGNDVNRTSAIVTGEGGVDLQILSPQSSDAGVYVCRCVNNEGSSEDNGTITCEFVCVCVFVCVHVYLCMFTCFVHSLPIKHSLPLTVNCVARQSEVVEDGEMVELCRADVPEGTPTGACVVFVVDESRSMANEHQWLVGFSQLLEEELNKAGDTFIICTNTYTIFTWLNATS